MPTQEKRKNMNLIQVATWIQEGYREYYQAIKNRGNKLNYIEPCPEYVFRYVMKQGKGHLNPHQISTLIEMEDSVPDQDGFV